MSEAETPPEGFTEISLDNRPDVGKIVDVITRNGVTTQGMRSVNFYRDVVLLRGTDGLFWRSMTDAVKYWRYAQ